MSAILSHPLYTKTTKNLERTAVRDKLLRLVQYFSRFASWYAFRKGYTAQAIARWKVAQKQISLARKLFRVGKPLSNLRALVAELQNHTSDQLIHLTTILKNIGTGGYLTLDILVWANTTGAYKFAGTKGKTLGDWSQRLWLLALVAGIVENSYKAYRSDATIKALEQESEKDLSSLKLAHAEKAKAIKMVVWHALDSLLPLTSLGYTGYSDGTVGLAGFITSWLGLRSVW